MYIVYNETGAIVEKIYYNPVPEQTTEKGLFLENETVPQPSSIPSLLPVLKFKIDEKKLYYDYESSNTVEHKVRKLEVENEKFQKENAALMVKLAEKGVL